MKVKDLMFLLRLYDPDMELGFMRETPDGTYIPIQYEGCSVGSSKDCDNAIYIYFH